MKVRVKARLWSAAGGEIVTAVLSNEPPESRDRDAVLVVDGSTWHGRYDVLGLEGSGCV